MHVLFKLGRILELFKRVWASEFHEESNSKVVFNVRETSQHDLFPWPKVESIGVMSVAAIFIRRDLKFQISVLTKVYWIVEINSLKESFLDCWEGTICPKYLSILFLFNRAILQDSIESCLFEVHICNWCIEECFDVFKAFYSCYQDLLNVSSSDRKDSVRLFSIRVVMCGIIRHVDTSFIHRNHWFNDFLLYSCSFPTMQSSHGDTQIERSTLLFKAFNSRVFSLLIDIDLVTLLG